MNTYTSMKRYDTLDSLLANNILRILWEDRPTSIPHSPKITQLEVHFIPLKVPNYCMHF